MLIAPRRFATRYSLLARPPLGGLALLIACAQPPVQWAGAPEPLQGTITDASALVLRGVPGHLVATPEAILAPGAGLPALGTGACLTSVRWARDGVSGVALVWWAARPDSSVTLQLSRSRDDGAHWENPRIAETRDRGVRGCSRPAPAVVLDAGNGYTHLVYFLEPATGAGIFYEHLMELPVQTTTGSVSTQAMFHAPVAIVYGQTPREAGVAAHGDTVVVAYQDPNGPGPSIEVVVSVTAGHVFSQSVTATGVGVGARSPLAAVKEGMIAVGWRESAFRRDGVVDSGPAPVDRAVVRMGDLR